MRPAILRGVLVCGHTALLLQKTKHLSVTWFFLALCAALVVATTVLLEKKTLSVDRTIDFSLMLALTNAVLSVVVLLAAGDFRQIDLWTIVLIGALSVPVTMAFYLSMKVVKHAAMSETSPFYALSPLVAAALAFVLLDEHLTQRHIAAMLLMVAGILLLEFRNWRTATGLFCKGRGKYLAMLCVAVLLYGIGEVVDRLFLTVMGVDPLTFLALIQVFVAADFLIMFLIMPLPRGEFLAGMRRTWKAILLLSALTFLHRYLYVAAVAVAPGIGLAVAVKRLSGLFTVVVAGRLFHEGDIGRKVVAATVITAGLMLLV